MFSEPERSDALAIIATCAFMRWLNFLWETRALRILDIGARMLPILEALLDTAGFLVVLASVVFGSVHAYYVLGAWSEPTPFYAAFVHIFRLAYPRRSRFIRAGGSGCRDGFGRQRFRAARSDPE